MLTDFENSFKDRLISKFLVKTVIKYPTTPQMHCYTNLWNCCIQKLQWPGINCVDRITMQDSAIQTICWKIFTRWH